MSGSIQRHPDLHNATNVLLTQPNWIVQTCEKCFHATNRLGWNVDAMERV